MQGDTLQVVTRKCIDPNEKCMKSLITFIEFYFVIGLGYKDIKSVLGRRHGLHLSERNLMRIFGALIASLLN